DVREDTRIRPYHRVLPDGDAPAIVQQRALPDPYPVLDRPVIAVGEDDPGKDPHPAPHPGEQVAPQHAAEAQAKPMIEPDRRAVEHLPEPQERLWLAEILAVPLRAH